MSIFSRQKLGEAAQELADHLRVIEDIKALQTGQKEMADAFAKLAERIARIEADLRAFKAETKLECVRETQQTVNAVQGALYDKIQELAVKLALLESASTFKPSSMRLPPPADGPQGSA